MKPQLLFYGFFFWFFVVFLHFVAMINVAIVFFFSNWQHLNCILTILPAHFFQTHLDSQRYCDHAHPVPECTKIQIGFFSSSSLSDF